MKFETPDNEWIYRDTVSTVETHKKDILQDNYKREMLLNLDKCQLVDFILKREEKKKSSDTFASRLDSYTLNCLTNMGNGKYVVDLDELYPLMRLLNGSITELMIYTPDGSISYRGA